MQEIKNLEKILEELEYLNTSILQKLENLEKKGVIRDLENLLKKLQNFKPIIEKLNDTSLILRVIYYAILVDKQLVKRVEEVAKELGDDEVIEFLDKRS
jgi:hypothetical protein